MFYSTEALYADVTFGWPGPGGDPNGGMSVWLLPNKNVPHFVAARLNVSSGSGWGSASNFSVFSRPRGRNAQKGSHVWQSTGIATSPTTTTRLLGPNNDSSFLRGYLPFWALWRGLKSDSELLEIVENPWQLFRPYRPKVYSFPTGAGSSYNVSISEAASASDSVSAALVAVDSISEAASALDSISGALIAASAIAEAASAADQVSADAAGYNVSISEAATATDALSAVLQAASALSESASVSDTVSSLATLVAALAEAVTLTDSTSSALNGTSYNVSISEAASALDSLSAALVAASTLSESANATDAVAALAQLSAAVAEAATALEVLTVNGVYGISITESVTLTDSVSAPTGFGETPPSRTVTLRMADRTISVRLPSRTITVH